MCIRDSDIADDHQAHNTGVGLVIVCDIEPAEFYSETLKAKGLTSTIEPEE